MEIVWDKLKALLNWKKHGVSFDEAATALADSLAETFLDTVEGEFRFITIGQSALQRILLVVWCERGESRIRIISARKATKRERESYEKGI